MSTERFFSADPYNDEHIRLFKEFENNNGISNETSSYLNNIRVNKTEESYKEQVRESNEINQILFLQDDTEITDSCHIQGEKDMKSCRIFFAPITTTGRNRQLVSLATDYAINVMGMEDVFVTVTTDGTDRLLRENLEEKGFENLGEDDGTVTYLKEKVEIKEIGKSL